MLAGTGACKSAPKYEQSLHEIVLHNLHYRRPEGRSAQLVAEPGDEEYESKPRPDDKLDCRPYPELFQAIQLQSLRDCLASLKPTETAPIVRYRLVRETQPYLAIQEPETAPLCLKQVLPRIPLPREIVYQAKHNGTVSCYSSRLNLSVDEMFGYKVPTHRYEVVLRPPISNVPKTDDETRLLLLTWAIQPFLDEEQHVFKAYLLPEQLCGKCMTGSKRFTDLDTLPPQWP